MPLIPEKTKCQAEAEDFADAIQKVMASGKLEDLIKAFENNLEGDFHKILKDLDIKDTMKEKMKKGAFKNTTVTFTWF
ncbi:MAG: hypothetical protein P8Y18_11710 [Candidatus Bathyarchaeota archaeon]